MAIQDVASLGIERALAIPGWMSEPELAWLAHEARRHSRIVELGSMLGRSTRALADNTSGWVMAFDDWRGPRDAFCDHTIDSQGNKVSVDKIAIRDMEFDFYEAFKYHTADLLESGRLKILKGDHADSSIIPTEFLRGSDVEKPDMVFIDGNHEYEDVKRDIAIWSCRLAKGGLLCGHDVYLDGVFNAILQAFGNRWNQVPMTDIWEVTLA